MTSFILPFRMGARIALIGMGKTNLAILEVLQRRKDLIISLRDKKAFSLPEGLSPDNAVKVYCGEGYLDDLSEEFLFLSPTVRVDSDPIRKARLRGAKVSSDVCFFLEHTRSVCFGVTGSDGKSTTTSLSNAILCESGEVSRVGGNIGKVLMPYLFLEDPYDFCILELSSFQLQLPTKGIQRGLITNLTPNHLDFHSSLEEYYNAKISLLSSVDKPILNCDDQEIIRRSSSLSPFVTYSMEEKARVRCAHEYTVKDNVVHLNGLPYLSLDAFLPQGKTFLKNIVASLALTHGYHTKDIARRAILSFQPLRHRRQLIGVLEGVSYYDCSADTTPSRTLETLSSFSSPIVLLMGGRSKGVDYDILSPIVKQMVRYVILCGENVAQIQSALSSLSVRCEVVASLSEAVRLAKVVAQAGDAVVFSPGSTSFDQYQNYEARGAHFASLVKQ